MLEHIQMKVFPFLKTFNGEESLFAQYMVNAVFMIPKASLLGDAVKIIEDIYVEIDKDASEKGQSFQDIQGDVYEKLLSEISTSGKNGQFRTPRHIIKLITELLEPDINDTICDPACGTGGFLLGAYQYIITTLCTDKSKLYSDEDGFIRASNVSKIKPVEYRKINNLLFGFDIDITMVRLALMNLIMHGVDNPKIAYQDTLSKNFDIQQRYHVIMANPPFTGSIDKGDINTGLTLRTTKTELLFLENIYTLLRPKGRAGVIVPQGVLFGTSKAFIETRKLLLEKCTLQAVISMPSGVFKPYAGVSTAILLFSKGGKTNSVWFYDMQSDGYSLDDRREKQHGYGDLQDIIQRYRTREHYSTLLQVISRRQTRKQQYLKSESHSPALRVREWLSQYQVLC